MRERLYVSECMLYVCTQYICAHDNNVVVARLFGKKNIGSWSSNSNRNDSDSVPKEMKYGVAHTFISLRATRMCVVYEHSRTEIKTHALTIVHHTHTHHPYNSYLWKCVRALQLSGILFMFHVELISFGPRLSLHYFTFLFFFVFF